MPQQIAVGVAVAPALTTGLFLRFVVVPNALRGETQTLALQHRQLLERLPELRPPNLQFAQRRSCYPVKPAGVIEHCGIPALLHVGKYGGNPVFYGRISGVGPVQPRLEALREVGLPG